MHTCFLLPVEIDDEAAAIVLFQQALGRDGILAMKVVVGKSATKHCIHQITISVPATDIPTLQSRVLRVLPNAVVDAATPGQLLIHPSAETLGISFLLKGSILKSESDQPNIDDIQFCLPSSMLASIYEFLRSAQIHANMTHHKSIILPLAHPSKHIEFAAANPSLDQPSPRFNITADLYVHDWSSCFQSCHEHKLIQTDISAEEEELAWDLALKQRQFTICVELASACSLDLNIRNRHHPESPHVVATSLTFTRTRVLSIQSHVVWGHVGNCSVTFPLQLLGCEVSALNTVHFATHTGHRVIAGQRLASADVAVIIDGLRANGLLPSFSGLLTGYIANAQILSTVAAVAQELATLRPHLRYVCDPVLGDNGGPLDPGGLYVPSDMVPMFRSHITACRPWLVTPNAFEAQSLTGCGPILSVEAAAAAMDALHAMGAQIVVMTSSWIELRPGTLLLLASCPWSEVWRECGDALSTSAASTLASLDGLQLYGDGPRRGILFPGRQSAAAADRKGHARFGICVPRLVLRSIFVLTQRAQPQAFTGTGDLLAALLLAHSEGIQGGFALACEKAVATMFAVCRRTLRASQVDLQCAGVSRAAATELQLIDSRDDILHPRLRSDMQAFAIDAAATAEPTQER